MNFNVLTIFPKLIDYYCNESILGRAQDNEIINIEAVNIRDFADDKHNTVDDKPYGGGAGMVMKPEPIYNSLESVDAFSDQRSNKKTILLSAKGKENKNKKMPQTL